MLRIGFLSHLDLNLYLFRKPIIQALLTQGLKVYAICPKGDYNTALAKIGCTIINYEIDRQGLNPFKERRSIGNIYRAIMPLHLDLIHTFTAKPNIYGTFAARQAGIPVILNLVEGLGSFYIRNGFKNHMVRFIMEALYKKAFRSSNTCVFVNSDDPEYMIRKHIIPKEKVRIIKSVGVDTAYFDPSRVSKQTVQTLRKTLHVKGKKVVLMVARAIWDKGITEYFEAAKALQNDSVRFILVGDTDAGNPSCADPDFLNQPHVLWLGHRNDILELTAMADIYVLPSYREGVPRTLLEAASMAKPIVATDVVGCKEVVEHHKNGLLVPPKNVPALTAAIQTLLDDEALCKTMGAYGRSKAINEFDVNQVVAQYLELYNSYLHFE